MLAREVIDACTGRGHEVDARGRERLDITDPRSIDSAVDEFEPDSIVNCAAWSDVDGAEDDERGAHLVNDTGAALLAAAGRRVGASIVYPSSDYVFDGSKGAPYVESDAPRPLSVYAQSKLAGERMTTEANPRHFVVRSAWLFGLAGRNFADTMLRLASDHGEVIVVRDQVGSPTYTGHLAEAIVRLVDTDAYGVHHVAAAGECSWYELALEVFRQAAVDCRVLSCATEELARPAPRPPYSALATERPEAILLPDWELGLAAYLDERARAA